MAIHFKDKFRTLRKSFELTQEQVADIFHVAPQTVSRWEKGINYPDTELLPHIALFFKTTVDALLGTQEMAIEEQARKYIADIHHALNAGQTGKAVSIARRAIAAFPVYYPLQVALMNALITANAAQHHAEIVQIGERIFNHCTDKKAADDARMFLFRHYIDRGEKDEAQAICATLTAEAWVTQDATLHYLLEGEAWRQNIQLTIIRFTNLLCEVITGYAHKADLPPLNRAEWLQKVMQIQAFTAPLAEHDTASRVGKAFQHADIARCYSEAGDIENTLLYVEKATEDALYHTTHMDTPDENGDNYMPWHTNRNLPWILREDWFNHPAFDPVREEKRFAACIATLTEQSGTLL